MINQPTTGRLLEGVVDTLETVVLPELARGSAARRQLHAAIDILRRLAFAAPRIGPSLEADNADIAATLYDIFDWLSFPGCDLVEAALAAARAEPDREARNALLIAAVNDLQADIEGMALEYESEPQITRRLRALYRRMLEREMALFPPTRHAKGSP